MKTTIVTYHCLGCGADREIALTPEPQWRWNHRSGPRVLCLKCGAATYPKPWHAVAATERDQDERLDLHLMEALWSACPNAAQCLVVGQYAGDCEEGLPARPKCLVAIHHGHESIKSRLGALERSQPRRRAGKAKE
jgi:hypothetical protein